jgi:hypothetical protein
MRQSRRFLLRLSRSHGAASINATKSPLGLVGLRNGAFGPTVVAFLLANLIDWPWHLAGSGAVWAAALGGLLSVKALEGVQGSPARA